MITVSTGIEFADYVHAALCEPLGIDIKIESSAGHGFSASVDALIPVVQEFLSPQLISPQTLHEALSNQYADLAGIVPGYGRHNPCPWGLGFELHGTKTPHWMGDSLPTDMAGHFGQAGTFLWFHPASQRAVIVLTDEMFGEWSKDLWPEFNNKLWEDMNKREK